MLAFLVNHFHVLIYLTLRLTFMLKLSDKLLFLCKTVLIIVFIKPNTFLE